MPKPLFTKLIATIAIGFACLFIGIVYFIPTRDNIFLTLSTILFACSIVKALLLYRIIRKQNYISFYGTCLGLKKHPIRRTSVITFSLDDDSTFELALDRVMKLHKNTKYELYFEVCKTLNSRHDLGSPLRFLCLERT